MHRIRHQFRLQVQTPDKALSPPSTTRRVVARAAFQPIEPPLVSDARDRGQFRLAAPRARFELFAPTTRPVPRREPAGAAGTVIVADSALG